MQTRREFLQRAALLSGSTLAMGSLTKSILAAAEIEPAPGSSFLDAEHVVILMQENRSFDHAFGAMRGVRGFGDPRAFRLPNGNPVFLQTNSAGETYGPFRFDIKDSNITWIGGLPHSWADQVDARNEGRYDRWLDVKRNGHPDAKGMPMVMGHYNREDLPFYYALADAFTVCDYNFCSSLTGTTPNRLFLWSGTVRPTHDGTSQAVVRNGEADYGSEVSWRTFPELLESQGVSWRVYQNELSLDSGFEGEEDAWLSNFTDNPLEFFTQYNVRLNGSHLAWLEEQERSLTPHSGLTDSQIDELNKKRDALREYRAKWNPEAFAALSDREKAIHRKGFAINDGDPDFRKLGSLTYEDGDTKREMQVPLGDVLHRFRKDVESGELPTVSWLVPSEHYSDHPGSAWYGAWYLAEVLNILTKNPEVWRKTVFILTYDENDGWFDHIPPFVAPRPGHPETGRTSPGIDTAVDYVEKAQDMEREPERAARGSAIGLGYRVPMVIASPWSRGGAVCSQVFDHTSTIQFVERLVSHKLKRTIREDNISDWRRCVCGDLTSVFRDPKDGDPDLLKVDHDEFHAQIHKAKFRPKPQGYRRLEPGDVAEMTQSGRYAEYEPGTRPSCPLPYELHVEETGNASGVLGLKFRVGKGVAGRTVAGAPFSAYIYGSEFSARSYAVRAGESLAEEIPFGGDTTVRIDAPNGFMREFRSPGPLEIRETNLPNGDLRLSIRNAGPQLAVVNLADMAYGDAARSVRIDSGKTATLTVPASRTGGWYDVRIGVLANPGYHRRLAGRVETGKWSTSDPAMGRAA